MRFPVTDSARRVSSSRGASDAKALQATRSFMSSSDFLYFFVSSKLISVTTFLTSSYLRRRPLTASSSDSTEVLRVVTSSSMAVFSFFTFVRASAHFV